MEGKTLQVTLRVYKGPVNYDAKGKVKSENQAVVLAFGSGAWKNYLKYARLNHTDMEVEKVVEETMAAIDTGRKNAQGFKITRPEFSEKEIDTPAHIKAAVLLAMSAPVAELTDEQKQIAEMARKNEEMQKQIDALTSGKDNTPMIDEERDAAAATHMELFGKKPHHATGLEGIIKKNNAEKERIANENK